MTTTLQPTALLREARRRSIPFAIDRKKNAGSTPWRKGAHDQRRSDRRGLPHALSKFVSGEVDIARWSLTPKTANERPECQPKSFRDRAAQHCGPSKHSPRLYAAVRRDIVASSPLPEIERTEPDCRLHRRLSLENFPSPQNHPFQPKIA